MTFDVISQRYITRNSSPRVLRLHPLPISAALHVGDPLRVFQIPGDGFLDAGLKGFGWLPAKFALELAGVYGVAAIMAGAVFNVRDLRAVALSVGLGPHLV